MRDRNVAEVVLFACLLLSSCSAAVQDEPPLGLVKMGGFLGTSAKAANTELERSWYDWDTLAKTVTVDRRERQTVDAEWDQQVQSFSTDYFVIDVRCLLEGTDIRHLFVAGLYPDGEACIEDWKFARETSPMPLPIGQRPRPAMERTELFRGTTFGRIRSVEPDPDGRFLLFLTRETHCVHRMQLPFGATSAVLTPSQQPYLANGKQLVARHHVTAGRQFQVLQDPRWEARLDVPQSIVILHDTDDDTTFESSETITLDTWRQRGYDEPSAWTLF